MKISILVASQQHVHHADAICQLLAQSAQERGTGIAKRSVSYVTKKITNGHAVIALDEDKVAGFCYIESWSHGKFVANSGLIVHKNYRKIGLGKDIKQVIFDLSKSKFPNAKIFGITTSMAVMKINSKLGYQPVTFSELTDDQSFWKGCQSCQNYDILTRNEHKMCLCTGMLYNPNEESEPFNYKNKSKILKRLKRIKSVMMSKKKKEKN